MKFLMPMAHTHFDSTDSTNTRLIEDIIDSTHPHTHHRLYTASHQTKGRGQHGRVWVSGIDNVFLSLYVPMGCKPLALHTLSGLLSLSVGYELANLPMIQNINHARRQHNLPMIGVKWANDVGFYDNNLKIFKKLAGILIEPVFKRLDKNTLVGVVIGVGLNVQSSPPIKDGLYHATCLADLTDVKTTAWQLYTPITNAILQAINGCNQCSNHVYLQDFMARFNACHVLTNKHIAIFMQNNMTDIYAQGKCIGIGSDGELLLQTDNGIHQVYAGMAKIINTP